MDLGALVGEGGRESDDGDNDDDDDDMGLGNNNNDDDDNDDNNNDDNNDENAMQMKKEPQASAVTSVGKREASSDASLESKSISNLFKILFYICNIFVFFFEIVIIINNRTSKNN